MSNRPKSYKGYEDHVEKIVKNVVPDIKSLISNHSNSVGHIKDLTLEKVVRDMANVFQDLRNGISLVKSASKSESLTNIEVELNKIYKKQDEINKQKEEARKKKAEEEKKTKTNQLRQNKNNEGKVKKTSNTTNSVTSSRKPEATKGLKKRPSSSKEKVTVTNLKFPKENSYLNAQSKAAKGPSTDTITRLGRPKTTDGPTLRRPLPTSEHRRSNSVGPPREIYNPLGILKDEVDRAIREKKTFTIKGQFPAVKRALLKRGWIEKYHPNHRLNDDFRQFKFMEVTDLVDLLRNKEQAESVKKIIKSKLLKDHQVDLYWDHTYDAFKECPDNIKLTLINRFRRESFSYTSKQGLCQAAREAHWLQIPGVACINHPRCFVLTKGGDTKFFLRDFGLTAAVSLLKWVIKNNITGECKIISDTGKIPMKAFHFAVAECYKFIKQQTHQDIDEEIRDAMEVEWNEFLDQFYKIVHVGNHFKLADKDLDCLQETKDMVRKSNYLLNQLREYMPWLDMDGYMNIWILKPTNSSRGIGIHICRTLQYILEVVRKNPNRRYVIQKYIERPFLIHDTKFDIRQWFLVSSSYPLTIWLYKVCYLRFSSQTYNLRKLHESIHLTNNSVQAKYMQKNTRDPLLPSYGMWDSKQFKNYLSDIGFPEIFDTVIYPGMKQCITGAMIAHRDKIDRRKCCFELYGADFMLAENFEPWLLEINSNPALHASTPVTARLCPEVLEDVIKVVIDYDRNPKASTGNFELIYLEQMPASPKFKQKFQVTGKPLPENYFCDLEKDPTLLQTPPKPPEKFETPDPGKFLIQTRESMRDALKNLLDLVKREKLKRRSRREKSVEAKSEVFELGVPKPTELVSLYENSTISDAGSDHLSCEISNGGSQDTLTEDETRRVVKVLHDIKELRQKKNVLTSLVKVVDHFKNVKK
ncbi:tubulin monoglycylase TTLL3-like [Anthonomus grandis grandis]|uniref:tubulin monoglycylase TTLL3-like n=1 Tax=Anthonomus grandis grandis TaxID=2921223 RepID=UPI002165443F|nr:tubulin monoglycylase TTLL3-like [Anthonomus grandis grandis]